MTISVKKNYTINIVNLFNCLTLDPVEIPTGMECGFLIASTSGIKQADGGLIFIIEYGSKCEITEDWEPRLITKKVSYRLSKEQREQFDEMIKEDQWSDVC
jgi:hypothetical protein